MWKLICAILILFLGICSTNSQPYFQKITSGPLVNDFAWSQGSAWGDYDNDGDQDLVVTTFDNNCLSCTFPILLYRNDGNLNFTKILSGSIPQQNARSFGTAWGDYDNDGKLDLFVCTGLGDNNLLFHNDGNGNFSKITTGAIVNDGGDSRGCTWFDYDNDGRIDLFVVNQSSQNDFLYKNNGNGTFTKITTGALITDASSGKACSVADFNNDGLLDVFVICYDGQPDRLYYNTGSGNFVLTTGVIPPDNAWGSGCAWGDYDNDGWMDVFVTNQNTNNYLYHNNGNNTFTRILYESGPLSYGCSWLDIDNDGNQDLYVSNFAGVNFLYKNYGGGIFSKITSETIGTEQNWGIGNSYTDINMDGKVDLFTANNGPQGNPQNDLLYLNIYNNPNMKFLGVKLKACTNNKFAIGARIIVKAGGSTFSREVTSGQGFLSQSMLWQHFGLGNVNTIDSVIVKWPSGNLQRLSNVSLNQYITIDECTIGIISNGISLKYELLQNYPNPFNPSTYIEYSIPERTNVRIVVYDINGQKVQTLVNRVHSAGNYNLTFDTKELSSGIYFYKIESNSFSETRKMVLLK